MANIKSSAELKDAIHLLELEQEVKGELLKEQFKIVLESFKPTNLVMSTLNNITSSPYGLDTIVSSAVSLGVGYLINRRGISATGNIFKKIIGPVLQYGVKKTVAKHVHTVMSFGRAIVKHYTSKKNINSEKP